MTPSTAVRVTVAVAAAAIALTACSGGDGAPPPPSAGTPAATAPSGGSTAAPSAAPSAVPSSAEDSGVDPANPPEPIASVTIPATAPSRDDPKATMRVDLLSLQRRGELVVATFAFTPSSVDDTPAALYHWLGNTLWSPFLVDTVNLRRHDVIEGQQRRYQSAYLGGKFASGQTWYAFAAFAAPPPEVTEMDVAVIDGAPVVAGVPLS